MADDSLPRPTFKSARDAAAEQEVAAHACAYYRTEYFPIGDDDPKKQKSRFDGVMVRAGRIVGFCEIKGCYRCDFRDPRFPGGWAVSKRKVLEGQTLYQIVRVPVLFLVRFACETIARVSVRAQFTEIKDFGRHDRNSAGDVEPGALFAWDRLRVLKKHETQDPQSFDNPA